MPKEEPDSPKEERTEAEAAEAMDSTAPEAEGAEETQLSSSVPAEASAPMTDNPNLSKPVRKLALILSAVFSPLLVPTYACAIALWITPLSASSERTRFVVSAFIFLLTAMLPMSVIIFMMRSGKVGDSAITKRQERTWPFIITGLCYLGAAFFMYAKHAPHWLVYFFGGATVAIIIALIINSKWKISAHSMTMGGLFAMILYIAFHHLSVVAILPWLLGCLLLAGMVGSSRLLLLRHTPGQVYAGFLLGFAVEYAFMVI